MSKKILILQSSSRAFQPALDYLVDEYPGAEIHAVVPAGTSDSAEKKEIDNLIPLDEGGFKPQLERWQKLAENNYELVVVLYNNVMDTGYSNVEKIALQLDPDFVFGVDSFGCRVCFTRLSRLWLYLRRYLAKFSSALFSCLYVTFLLLLFFPYTLYRSLKHKMFKTS